MYVRPTVQGKPLTFGVVQFGADFEHGNRSWEQPIGQVQPDGSFEMMTGNRKGAPLGSWKVLVIADNLLFLDPPADPDWKPPKPFVHERYRTVKTTDVTVEVVEHPEEGAYLLKLNP